LRFVDRVGSDPRGRGAAIESYRNFQSKQIEYSQMVDVYAFGVVLHELLTHAIPWEREMREEKDYIGAIWSKVHFCPRLAQMMTLNNPKIRLK